ncbi:hypothetical protein, partial [Pseudomonas fontis]|uniref:hypothetical protein n=1 Tax=Pseudomonas fontis TaxID=2942633 RepID=UPI00235FC8E5
KNLTVPPFAGKAGSHKGGDDAWAQQNFHIRLPTIRAQLIVSPNGCATSARLRHIRHLRFTPSIKIES